MTAQKSGRMAEARVLPRSTPDVSALVEVLEGDHYAGAVVLGGPGMGKSSLVQTALALTDRTSDVLSVQCSLNLREVSYGALSPLLTALPELSAPVEVLRALQQLGAQPVIVVIDAQFLDAASAFVLAQLVQNRAAKLVAIGSGSLGRESGIAALADTGVLRTIHLEPADPQRVRRQCEQILEGPLTEGTVKTIHGMTGGNPRLINAYLASAREQGILVRAPGGAVLPGRPAPWILLEPAPDPDARLIDTVESMHATLLPGERETLDIVALAGQLTRGVVRAVTGEHVQGLLAAGFLRETGHDSVGLAAAIHAEVLRACIPPGRSVALFNRWRAVGGNAPEYRTARSVLWALECGHVLPVETIIDAGYRALQLKDWPTARALAPALAEDRSPRAALLMAELMLMGGRTWAGRTELENLAVRSVDADFTVEVLSLLAVEHVRSGEVAEPGKALPMLISRMLAKHPEPTVMDGPVAGVVELLVDDGTVEQRDSLLDACKRAMDDPATSDGMRVIMLLLQSDVLAMKGRATSAMPAAMEAYDRASAAPKLSARFGLHALVQLVIGYLVSGHLEEATRVLETQDDLEPRQWHHRSGTVLALRDLVESATGQPAHGPRRREDAVIELRASDPCQLLPFVEALLAPDLAALTVGAPNPTVEERARQPQYGARSRWLLALARFSIVEELNADAAGEDIPMWRRILDDPALEIFPVIRQEILYSAILLRDPLAVDRTLLEELHAVAAVTEGPRATAIARVMDPALGQDPRALAAAAETTTAEGQLLPAALCWARLVLVHHQAGDLRRRGEVLRRLKRLQNQAGVVFPPFVAGAMALGELTAREQEIVDLAARGMSNAAVADQLFVSQRTVEGHLYRVFTKLGITDRSELRDLQY
ncbi:LuxR C-terminal-related transcriptional regulator [Citricoccus sp. GCM10030269]|uniref:LuxR C-terminal-related transcriptional regulator n=1 Tax=Citricoccus sp. GCM10030269 TaxID=3273388 RepID=UPI003616BBF9